MGELREKLFGNRFALCAPEIPPCNPFIQFAPEKPEAILSLLVSLKAIPQRLLRNHSLCVPLKSPEH
jgi:hypothetical protein